MSAAGMSIRLSVYAQLRRDSVASRMVARLMSHSLPRTPNELHCFDAVPPREDLVLHPGAGVARLVSVDPHEQLLSSGGRLPPDAGHRGLPPLAGVEDDGPPVPDAHLVPEVRDSVSRLEEGCHGYFLTRKAAGIHSPRPLAPAPAQFSYLRPGMPTVNPRFLTCSRSLARMASICWRLRPRSRPWRWHRLSKRPPSSWAASSIGVVIR